MYDALLFFIIMLVGSTSILMTSSKPAERRELIERGFEMSYVENTKLAILDATLQKVWYLDSHNEKIYVHNHTILQLLNDEMLLILNGVPQSNFASGYERPIDMTINAAIIPYHHYKFEATFLKKGNRIYDLVFTDSSKEVLDKNDYNAYSSDLRMYVNGNIDTELTITLLIFDVSA